MSDELRRSIQSGELSAGAVVSIAALSDRFSVSHIPVREALRLLEGEGLIEFRPGRSAVVAAMNAGDLVGIFHLRGIIETDTVTRALRLYSEGDLKAIEQAFEAMVVAPHDDAQSVASRHNRFHRLLATPALTEWSSRLLARLWQASDRYLPPMLADVIAVSPTELRDQHAAVVEAVYDRSASRLRAAMVAHLDDDVRRIAPHVAADAPGETSQ